MSYPLINPVAKIGAGQSLSGAMQLSGRAFVGVFIDSGWTAAVLTFQGSPDGVTWSEVYDSGGNEVTFTVAAGNFCAGDPSNFVGLNWLKIRSGTSASAVNQVSAVNLTLALRQIPNLR